MFVAIYDLLSIFSRKWLGNFPLEGRSWNLLSHNSFPQKQRYGDFGSAKKMSDCDSGAKTKTLTSENRKLIFSFSSCCNPCNRHQGQLPNTEMTSTQTAILMLCGSIGGFFIYPILRHRFRHCFWKLNFKACSPALATNVGIHKYLLNKCLFLHN